MFGGRGIYVDELFVALIIIDHLYLKVDALSSPQFEAADSVPFKYRQGEQWHSMNCFSAPAEAMELPAAMKHWGRQETSEKILRKQPQKKTSWTGLTRRHQQLELRLGNAFQHAAAANWSSPSARLGD